MWAVLVLEATLVLVVPLFEIQCLSIVRHHLLVSVNICLVDYFLCLAGIWYRAVFFPLFLTVAIVFLLLLGVQDLSVMAVNIGFEVFCGGIRAF